MAVAARAISSVGVLAVVAPFDSTAQRRRPAGFDGLHQAMLMQGQGMCLPVGGAVLRSEEHTSELQSLRHLVCRLLLEKKNTTNTTNARAASAAPGEPVTPNMEHP